MIRILSYPKPVAAERPGFVDSPAEVFPLRKRKKMRKESVLLEVEDAPLLEIVLIRFLRVDAILLQRGLRVDKTLFSISEKDQPEDRSGELRRTEPCICPQLIGSAPEAVFDFPDARCE